MLGRPSGARLPPGRGAAAAAALLLAPLLAGCAAPLPGAPVGEGRSPGPGAAGLPEDRSVELLVGTVLPHTGPLQRVGPLMRLAADAAAAQVNAAPQAGLRLRLVHEDSGSEAAGAVAALHKLRSQGAVAVVGEVVSGSTLAMYEAAGPARMLVVSPGSSSPELTERTAAQAPGDRFLVRTVPSDALRGRVAAQFALAGNWTQVALLHEDSPYGRGFARVFSAALGGDAAVRAVAFAPGQTTYASELERALAGCAGGPAGCPRALVFAGLSAAADQALRDWWARPGWRGVPWFFAEAEQGTFDAMRAAGVAFPGGAWGASHVGSGPGWAAYLALMRQEVPPFTAAAYDAVMLLALAAQRAGRADAEALRDALRDVANPPGAEVGPADYARASALLRAGEDVDYDGAAGAQDLDALGDVASGFEVFTLDRDLRMVRHCLVPEEDVVREPPRLPASCAPSP